MPVLNTDIKYYASGSKNLGGLINTTQEIESGALHALFDAVTASEALVGMTDYRCLYVRVESPTDTLTDASVYLETPPAAVGSNIQVGVGAAAVNGEEAEITNETDIPPGVVFVTANTPEAAVLLGDLGPNDYRALWVKRIISAGTSAVSNDTFTLSTLGETV